MKNKVKQQQAITALLLGMSLVCAFYFSTNNKSSLFTANLKDIDTNPEIGLADIIELSEYSWYLECQFYPEYRSTIEKLRPFFLHFV